MFPLIIFLTVMFSTASTETERRVAFDPADTFACTIPDDWAKAMGSGAACPTVVLQDVARWTYVRDLLSQQALEAMPMAKSENDVVAIVLAVFFVIFIAFPALAHILSLWDFYLAGLVRLGFHSAVALLGHAAFDS